MKIAVTGATGGLGRSLCEFLIQQGVDVVALGRNEQVGNELTNLGARFHKGDLADLTYLTEAFAGCELVVHSAGLASPWGPWETFYQANVIGTKNVLAAAREVGISRLIYLSTPSVYFSGKPIVKVKEDSILPEAKTFYAKSKIMADKLVLDEVSARNLNAILLRPRSIFGKYDSAILPRILRVMKKGFFPLPNGGSAVVDVTAVENVVHLIWLAINSKEYFRGEIFNVTNGESMTVKELTSRISQALQLKVCFFSVPLWMLSFGASLFELYAKWVTHREPMVSKYSMESIGTTQTLSIDKAKLRLGYAPVISIERAIANYAKEFT